MTPFTFRATDGGGKPVVGQLDADTAAAVADRLREWRLNVTEVAPLPAVAKSRPLGLDDFETFNSQLAQLTTAGLPVEQGLRLIAEDLHSGRLASAVRAVSGDIESGRTLADAFAARSSLFPPLYAGLVRAGVASSNLPGLLLGFGRHLRMVRRMKRGLLGALAYPALVLATLVVVVLFLGLNVVPKFGLIFSEFKVDLPEITQMVEAIADFLKAYFWLLVAAFAALAIAAAVGIPITRRTPAGRARIEWVLLHTPLLGRVVRLNLTARWCDATALLVASGLDLPAAVTTSAEAIGSAAVSADSAMLVNAISSGSAEIGRRRVLPATAFAVVRRASAGDELARGLTTLGQSYQQQADARAGVIPAVLTPIFLLVMGLCVVFVLLALFAPMLSLITAVSGPGMSAHRHR